jgi:ubiquinone biosynthesis protein COQ9
MTQAKLFETFLLKLELERLHSLKSGGISNAEKALQTENKILRQRLRTLKDNIAVLNEMIDQIKFSSNKTQVKTASFRQTRTGRPWWSTTSTKCRAGNKK